MGYPIEHRDGRPGGPEGPLPAAGAAELAAGLEQIRACVHRWIARIEEHLDEAAGPRATSRDLEQAARALEDQREALRAEVEQRDREWAEHLEALEHDRRLLAEAWQRLEHAQVAGAAPPAWPDPGPPRAGPPGPAPRAAPPGVAPENPVDRAVLHQFEMLRRDVRRKAEAEAERHR